MAIDPVCGMEVDMQRSSLRTLYMGEEYGFCSDDCKVKFLNNPEKYSNPTFYKKAETSKIVVIGAGHVGAATCFALSMSGVASTIVLVDMNAELAEGHAMDLNHGLPFVKPSKIYAGDFSDCQDADVVVLTAGVSQNPGETRLDLVRKNTDIFLQIVPQVVIHKPGILLVVSNPVDILTYVTLKISKYPMNRVIGSGTTLDTARFRYLISQHCMVDPRNVHAYIIGEHGDSEVPVWSQANIAGRILGEGGTACVNSCSAKDKDAIFRQVKNAAYEIIKRKGYTDFAIALSVERIVSSILRNESSVLTVSSLVHGYHGISDVCLSIPAVLNVKGIDRHIDIDLSEEEERKLQASAQILRKIIDQLGISRESWGRP